MRTRYAKYEDLHRVLSYLKRQHEATDWGTIPFDVELVKRNLVGMIRTQDVFEVIIAEDKEKNIRGVLLACTDQYFWNKQRYASDLHFVASGGGAHVLNRFIRWAEERGCGSVIMAVATSDRRAEKLYERVGFQRVGGAMVRWLQEGKEQAA